MFRFNTGLLPLRLSPRLTDINKVINTINAAKKHTRRSLVCELHLAAQVESQFHYLLALLGHIYCYTYEVLGPRVYLTMPGHFKQPSALEYAANLEVMFEHKEYVVPLDYEDVCRKRKSKELPAIVQFALSEFPIHQFPPFYPKIPKDAIPKFGETVLGGTFDYLHPGHMLLLTSQALVTQNTIHVALTSDAMLTTKTFPEMIQHYRVREDEVRKVLAHIVPHKSPHIFPITDPVGPAATAESWEAIVLSREVEAAEGTINAKRRENGLAGLKTVLVDLVQLGTHKISSTDIRALISERAEYQVESMKQQWMHTCTVLEISAEKAGYWWTVLLNSYMRHDRYYHSLTQLSRMLQMKEDLHLDCNLGLNLAIWFHDIVFFPDSKNCEEHCAQTYEDFCRDTGLKGYEQVTDYILATRGHRTRTKDKEEQWLLDLDLAILGSDPLEYRHYAEAIKKEYSFSGGFESGRRKVLRKFLDRDSIFLTPLFRRLYEQQSRRNIMSELSTLS